jgi:hypothetical protein
VSTFKKLDLSNPECKVRQVDVEEWIDAGKGIVVSRAVAGADLIKLL